MATAAGSKPLGGGAWRGAGTWGARGREQPVSMVRAGEPSVGSLRTVRGEGGLLGCWSG